MDLDQAEKSSPETFSDSSGSPDSPDENDIFGDPLVHPRVGDEYQVEIPPMLSKSEFLHLMMNSTEDEKMGLPIPVLWVYNQAKNLIKDEKMESSNNPWANGPVKSEIRPNVVVDALNQTSMSNGYCLVPGLSTDSWSDFEADCFLLGLYVFGKNLILVKRFMESKEMGQILAFYYGRFYGSDGYRKWSECRKMRNRKCVLGHRFFTGYRQQELFSRLLPRLSEESKTKWSEASRAFAEGRSSLDEYVSTLTALVGIHALVEAVAIGKGKEDLTTFIIDSSKNSQILGHRPEIPSGKACSSLTCAEIVKYLTGDFRLSKARSNDLFWEAVWPRLLARGWHSEQPRGDGYTGSKNSLVFLFPGIKKFSRRKLVKGDHYFDSVSDVLAKVASEPQLLELEVDETRPSSSKGENGWAAVEQNSDDGRDHPSDHERHCYLKPRVSAGLGLSNLMKFTVVDTSLAHQDNPSNVRELRSLPLEAKRSRKTEKKSEGDAGIRSNGVQTSTFSVHSKGSSSDNNLHPLKMPTDHKPRAIKNQSGDRMKPGLSGYSDSIKKRRRLASCVDPNVTCVLSLPARPKNATFKATRKNIVTTKTTQSDVKLSSTISSAVSTPSEKILEENEKKPELHKIIDLNLPQLEAEPEIDANVKEESHSETEKSLVTCAKVEPSDKVVESDQLPRRQSTRNRPLTTKALEALEIGFLNPVRQSRKRSQSTAKDQKPKRSQQPRKESFISPNENGNDKAETIPNEREIAARQLLGLSKPSCPPEASILKGNVELFKC